MPNRTPGIRRAEIPADHFTTISNRWVRDKRLTWKARGVLAWLASHKIGFRISENTLIAAAPEGRDAVRGAIKELETHGYLVRERQRASSGKLGRVDYILCDPWTAGNRQVSTNDGFSVPGDAATPAPTTENPSKVPTSGNRVDAQAAPTTENPPQVPTSGNDASPQVSTNDGKSTPIRRTEDQKNKKKTTDHLLAVGERTVRTARGTAQTPPANEEDHSRLAGDVLGQMPDHYRQAPAWLRSRMLKRISEALADHEPLALIAYAHKFAADPNFGNYEHLRRFADVVRKLDADVADGTACPGCGRDPMHTFCSADIEGGTR
ncbi:hypothetical protein [Streptosporangium pseudovulgare]|uniref:Helix-turn-helix domain-containing protein n=1 Tax=Streptosporangium pseudovulgare TaxID=35765 RepID=A0ABQ2R4S2_9ACTN|nr:hypothetical protein [Streptosporangium pseudovulgare]GGQ11341.1 hypothetical protein GCM10010140_46870 [Streptosporangium pseudovulgare]